MAIVNRRSFLKGSGLVLLPALIPASPVLALEKISQHSTGEENPVYFFGDGIMYEPAKYIQQLLQADRKQPIEKDRYGTGGAVAVLEKKFEEITGKEKAMFMPSGTMANQFAIAVLSNSNTKVFVQDTSHVYRDEADAAQSVFQKRLMPLAKNETYFTAEALQQAIETLQEQEVFTSGIGAVSIENPVRRTDGRMVPVEEIRKISMYCRNKNIKLHLDGARIYMAAAWSGISIKEYASYFDTIYISLYKYLGASAGAVLCGDMKVMEKMPHLIKIHGGSMYGNWANAAMALHRMEGFEDRLKETVKKAEQVFAALNKISGLHISTLDGGTNIYMMQLPKETDGRKMQEKLRKDHQIWTGRLNEKNQILLTVNETLLQKENDYLINAFTDALVTAKS